MVDRPPRRNCVVDSSRDRHVCRVEAVEERYPLEAWKKEYGTIKQTGFSLHDNIHTFLTVLLMETVGRSYLNIEIIALGLVVLKSVDKNRLTFSLTVRLPSPSFLLETLKDGSPKIKNN